MKKHKLRVYRLIGYLLLLGLPVLSHAQTSADTSKILTTLKSTGDTSWTINVLQAPSSPGAGLLGISPSVIQRPTDPAGFSASLLNATNNLTAVPNNYAVDFAPAWLFGASKISYSDFASNNVGKNIWQTLDVSFAFENVKDSLTNQTNTSVAFGLKVSLLRGKINAKADTLVKTSYDLLSALTTIQDHQRFMYKKAHPDFAAQEKQLNLGHGKDTVLLARVSGVLDSLNKVADSIFNLSKAKKKGALDSLKSIGQSISFARYGLKLDLAGGMSYIFPSQVYSNGTLNNAGVWLTGGYDAPSGDVAILGIARYLYNPKQAYADADDVLKQSDLSTFDTGARLLFSTKDSKFTFGGEVVYRSILNDTPVKPSYHYSISTDYQVGKNQLISFNFGRDFDGTINKGGNLLAALNFIIGFGSNHSILPK